MRGTVGKVMLAAATMAAMSAGPVVTESLQHNSVAGQWRDALSADYDPEGHPPTSCTTSGLASKISYKCSVDFGSYSLENYQIEDGHTLWPGGSQTDTKALLQQAMDNGTTS